MKVLDDNKVTPLHRFPSATKIPTAAMNTSNLAEKVESVAVDGSPVVATLSKKEKIELRQLKRRFGN